MVAMKVLSSAEMQACDRLTVERFGVASLELMRHAAAAVSDFARQQFPGAEQITVLCGRGNNGGDGAMAARLLAESGREVTVLLLGDPGEWKGDAADAWRELESSQSCHVHVVERAQDLAYLQNAFEAGLIVDAVVGTGFKPPLRGLALEALEWVKASGAPVLAVDLPSGWPADELAAQFEGAAYPADAVITFTAPKPAHVFGQLTRRWNQPVVVAPIGSPDEAILSELGIHWAGGALKLVQRPRAADANKGRFGHVLVVGGTFGPAGGKAGAPAMTAMAAMRAGAGLVTAAVPAAALPVVSGFAPEMMTRPLEMNAAGEISAKNLERIEDLTRGATVLALGPGIGQSEDTARFCHGLLEATAIPAVLDADALNLMAHKPERLKMLTEGGRFLVLTPHPGEMARLAGKTTTEVQSNRLETARGFADRYNVTVVLKGARTLVAHPGGAVAVNTSGNPGMAKGGSGDLLTGIVAAFLAQNPGEPQKAVEAAVCLHGLAADLTVRETGEHALLATDTLSKFSPAFRFAARCKNGYVWLQGLPSGFIPELGA